MCKLLFVGLLSPFAQGGKSSIDIRHAVYRAAITMCFRLVLLQASKLAG
jgi:hypothetical protein